MKKLVTTFALLALCATTSHAANQVRISQVYGGGGSASATTFNVDYVELFNSGGTPVNLSGWTIEYGSATGNWGSSAPNIFTFPQGATIAPCSYVLVGQGVPGSGGAPLAPPADYSGNLTISATSGKVALFNAVQANVACGAEAGGTLVDKVSFGTGNCPEVANVAALNNTAAAVRNSGGLADTDNNSSDFTVVTNAQPRNSASPPNTECLATPATPISWGSVKSIYRN